MGVVDVSVLFESGCGSLKGMRSELNSLDALKSFIDDNFGHICQRDPPALRRFFGRVPTFLEELGAAEEAELFKKFGSASLEAMQCALLALLANLGREPPECVGYSQLRGELRRLVIEPRSKESLEFSPSKPFFSNVLLYGPPGCGKTALVKRMAFESGALLIETKLEAHDGMKFAAFEAANASENALVLVDEIDTFAFDRFAHDYGSAYMNSLLCAVEEASLSSGVQVFACTNMPWKLDSAVLRTGRFSYARYVGLPLPEDREALFKRYSEGVLTDGVDFAALAEKDYFHTCSDVKHVCVQAVRLAWNDGISSGRRVAVAQRHFEQALQATASSAVPWFDCITSLPRNELAREYLSGLCDDIERYAASKRPPRKVIAYTNAGLNSYS